MKKLKLLFFLSAIAAQAHCQFNCTQLKKGWGLSCDATMRTQVDTSATGVATQYDLTLVGGGGTVTNIATASPITGGPITTTGTIAINNAAADGSTKGAASFTATDFDATTGNISIDYTNGQAASGSNKGFLTSADWTTFNNKLSAAITSLNGLTGATQTFATGTSGSDFNIASASTTHTFNIPDASASNRGLITTGVQTIAGAKTFSSAVTIPNGSTGAPALVIGTGVDGLSTVAATSMAFTIGGSSRFSMSTTQIVSTGTRGILLLRNTGGVGAAVYSFNGDANTGMYSDAADVLQFTTGGVLSTTIDASQRMGIGVASGAITAVLHLKAGTATASTAPLKFNSGTNLTATENGAVEYDGTDLFVSANATRQTIHKGKSGSFSQVGAATTVFTVTFGGTQPNATYKVLVTPTAILSAALFYVTNKTTTTFDVTYLAGLTGTVPFDYVIIQ